MAIIEFLFILINNQFGGVFLCGAKYIYIIFMFGIEEIKDYTTVYLSAFRFLFKHSVIFHSILESGLYITMQLGKTHHAWKLPLVLSKLKAPSDFCS